MKPRTEVYTLPLITSLPLGPAYLLVVLLLALPAAFYLWSHKEFCLFDAWIGALLLSSISTCLVLYSLGLLGQVQSVFFLISPILLPALFLLWAYSRAAKNRSLRHFVGAHGGDLDHGFTLVSALAGITVLLSVFAVKLFPHFYDSWNYHLSIAAMALSTGRIPLAFSHPYVSSSPPFLELWKTWVWLIFGKIGVVEANQLPFAFALSCLSFHVARTLFAVRARYCVLAALFVFFSPKLLESALSSYLDIQIGFYLAAAIYFLAIRRPALAFIGSAAAAAFKFSAASSATVTLAISAIWLIRRKGWRGFLMVSAGSIVFLSWFALNLHRFGNPLYPYILQHSEFIPSILVKVFPNIFTCMSQAPCWDGFYIQKIEDVRVHSGFGFGSLRSLWLSWLDIECLPYEEYLARWGPGLAILGSASFVLTLLLTFARTCWRKDHWRRPRSIYIFVCSVSLYLTIKPQEARLVFFALPLFFGTFTWWLQAGLRAMKSSPWLKNAALVFTVLILFWTAAHGIFRQSRLLKFWERDFSVNNGVDAILFSMPAPGSLQLHSLALAVQTECREDPVFVDFDFGLQHSYGFAPAAVYAFVREDWRIATEHIEASRARDFLGERGRRCLVVFPGSRQREWLGDPNTERRWHRIAGNELGEVYRADSD